MRTERLLFVCTGNSCRSQMAEGWARHLLADRFEVASAGIEHRELNAVAVRVMAERGIDISAHYSKTIEELGPERFDWVITVCANAHEACPIFPGENVIHQGFDDPPTLASELKGDVSVLDCYRRVRDQIGEYVASLQQILR